MASNSQNNPLTYMDGISVKIAENYKPPKRIPMVMSYSQRVALNKLIQEPILTYDFSREESIKSKMYEWQKARTAIKEQRKQRLNQITQAMNIKSPENEVLENSESKTIKSENIQDNVPSDTRVSSVDPYYQTESGILIPKIISTEQSKLLTPIPLTNSHQITAVASRDIQNYTHKYPINYSEFESDTSSPFDNMELKVLNDFEELAQVLKYDSDDNVTCNSFGPNQPKENISCQKINKFTSNYASDNMYCKLDNHMLSYGIDRTVNTKKLPPNGYYYNNYSQNTLTTQIAASEDSSLKDVSFRSVSEIMRSLEADLEITHIADTKSNAKVSTETSVASKPSKDDLDDPFKILNPDIQKLALTISSMGFPLPRVARACQLLEGNQKKVCMSAFTISMVYDNDIYLL